MKDHIDLPSQAIYADKCFFEGKSTYLSGQYKEVCK